MSFGIHPRHPEDDSVQMEEVSTASYNSPEALGQACLVVDVSQKP